MGLCIVELKTEDPNARTEVHHRITDGAELTVLLQTIIAELTELEATKVGAGRDGDHHGGAGGHQREAKDHHSEASGAEDHHSGANGTGGQSEVSRAEDHGKAGDQSGAQDHSRVLTRGTLPTITCVFDFILHSYLFFT